MAHTKADYLRRKAQRCCELAAACNTEISEKLLALALDMEVMAAAMELEQGQGPSRSPGQSPDIGDEQPGADGPREPIRRQEPHHSTVLFVDDDGDVREVVIQMLADKGFAVLSAPDARTALRVLAERPVDLLFADITMPEIDGVELARRARVLDPGIKVLFATGYPTRAAQRDATDYGKLLLKPLRQDELLREVQVALCA